MDNSEYELLKTVVKDSTIGQTMALALVVNFLIDKGLIDRIEIVDALNRAYNFNRSEDLRGFQSGAIADLASAIQKLAGG